MTLANAVSADLPVADVTATAQELWAVFMAAAYSARMDLLLFLYCQRLEAAGNAWNENES